MGKHVLEIQDVWTVKTLLWQKTKRKLSLPPGIAAKLYGCMVAAGQGGALLSGCFAGVSDLSVDSFAVGAETIAAIWFTTFYL